MELFYLTGAYTCYTGMLGKPQKGMWKVVGPTLAASGLSLFYTYCFGGCLSELDKVVLPPQWMDDRLVILIVCMLG